MITREEIAAALSAVPGITGYPSSPSAIVAGAAWPAWAQTRWLNVAARQVQWYIFVSLSSGSHEASVLEADGLIEAVGVALADIGLGGLIVEPWFWATEPGQQPTAVLRFTAFD